MKHLAIGTLKPMSAEQQQHFMPLEVPATLQIYLDGNMEQFWFRQDGSGVVFLMSTDTREQADAMLRNLPLGRAGLLDFDLIEVGPLAPLGMLIKK
jgi:hypothetical protein